MVEVVLEKRDLSPAGSPGQEEPKPKKQTVEKISNGEVISIQKKQPKQRIIKYKAKSADPTSPSGVLKHEIKALLERNSLTADQIKNDMHSILNDAEANAAYHRLVNGVNVTDLSSNGDGLALIPHPVIESGFQIVLIPFAIPGDIVAIKTFKTHPNHVEADLIKIESPASDRNESLIKCGYFGRCSGCQYQMISYDVQLSWKRNTIINAYTYLAPDLIKNGKLPEIGTTIASPKQYNYRTKLTPHFDIKTKRRGQGKIPLLDSEGVEIRPSFGFGARTKYDWRDCGKGGDQATLDIEDCVIGTEIVNAGLKNERLKFLKEWENYNKSATVLLREHTRVFKDDMISLKDINEDDGSRDVESQNVSFIKEERDQDTLIKTCVINPRQIVTEYINGYTFQFSAGEFFQNNNSILPLVTEYVSTNLQIKNKPESSPLYLVDAYCGSGLFSITASKGVDKVVGVDVSKESIKFANLNAKRNGIENVKFIDGKAEKIFNEIDTPNDLTSVIIDPSRKGCDDVFLNQLSDYKPAKVVYISCNVHSQARDIQNFIENTENGKEYTVESVRGFDFFPQTHHVESVAVLSRVVF